MESTPVHYWEMPDHARALGARALELIRQYDVLPTPPNYELWFGYATGQNQDLIAALDAAVAQGKVQDMVHMRELHMRFFGGTLNMTLDELGAKLQAEIQKFAKVLEGAGQDTAAYGKTLNTAVQHLTGGDVGQIKVIIEGVVAATRAIEAKNKTLESELKTSSSEMHALRGRLESIRKESQIDPLTGLANRRGFDECIKVATREAMEEKAPLCLLIGDVDHFKKFNDTWGHATGDQVLRLVAQCFKSNTKGRDTAARYGGEEFVVALPQTTLANAMTVAEHIRQAVESKKIVKRSTGETLGSITLSLGVAQYVPGEAIEDTINRADACLYAAKRGGRNRVMSEKTVDPTELKRKATA
jgi:diguanylate cyclase